MRIFSTYFLSCKPLQIEKEETGNVEHTKKILGISVDLAQIIS